jgi:hypothetical protein
MGTQSSLPSDSVDITQKRNQPAELGMLSYINLTENGRHGLFEPVIPKATETNKLIFANFVEWPG